MVEMTCTNVFFFAMFLVAGGEKTTAIYLNHSESGWWFQPHLKKYYIVNLDHFSKYLDEN